MDLDFVPGNIKAIARGAFRSQWGVAILVTLFVGIFTLASDAISTVGQIVSNPKDYLELFDKDLINKIIDFYNDNYRIFLIASIAIGLFLAIVKYGECKVFTDVVEGKDASFSSVFDGFLYPVKAVAANIYIIILTALWTFLFVIPGLIAAIKYSMTYYIIAENPDIPITDAVDMSKNMMDGHKMDYFMLVLSFIPWLLLTTITFGLASVYVLPYMNCAYAQFYVMVRDEYNMANEVIREDRDLEE